MHAGLALPYQFPEIAAATAVAASVVIAAGRQRIAWVRARFMDTPLLSAAIFQVVVGGVLSCFAGIYDRRCVVFVLLQGCHLRIAFPHPEDPPCSSSSVSAAFQNSRRLYAEAIKSPGGVTHGTVAGPFPVYARSTKGSPDQDVDGHELIDFQRSLMPSSATAAMTSFELFCRSRSRRQPIPGHVYESEIRWGTRTEAGATSAEQVQLQELGYRKAFR
ncbi:MAG: hypothetical protein U0746_18285 [Gemmataceae bacterium]